MEPVIQAVPGERQVDDAVLVKAAGFMFQIEESLARLVTEIWIDTADQHTGRLKFQLVYKTVR